MEIDSTCVFRWWFHRKQKLGSETRWLDGMVFEAKILLWILGGKRVVVAGGRGVDFVVVVVMLDKTGGHAQPGGAFTVLK